MMNPGPVFLPPPKGIDTMLLTGAQILIKTLISQGVDAIFGYPGGAVLNIYDALHEMRGEIRHVTTSPHKLRYLDVNPANLEQEYLY